MLCEERNGRKKKKVSGEHLDKLNICKTIRLDLMENFEATKIN